ncbi:MAG: GspH/FimT family pseudopilin [Phycisphaerae bacterium]
MVRRKPQAFTLVEIIIVVVILSIIAAVSVPSWSTASDSAQSMAALRIVSADLEYAQSIAITYRKEVTVEFDISGDSYTVKDAGGFVTHPINRDDFAVDLNDISGTDKADITAAEFGSPTGVKLVFDETGTPVGAGGSLTIKVGETTSKIHVSTATGRVTVE